MIKRLQIFLVRIYYYVQRYILCHFISVLEAALIRAIHPRSLVMLGLILSTSGCSTTSPNNSLVSESVPSALPLPHKAQLIGFTRDIYPVRSDVALIGIAEETLVDLPSTNQPVNGQTLVWLSISRRAAPSLQELDALLNPPKQRVETFVIDGSTNFAFDSARLRNESLTALQDALTQITSTNGPVRIVGHTDSIGSEPYNQGLGMKRARAVADWLAQRGVSKERMQIGSQGESSPIASNSTPEGRSRNRRAEVSVTIELDSVLPQKKAQQ